MPRQFPPSACLRRAHLLQSLSCSQTMVAFWSSHCSKLHLHLVFQKTKLCPVWTEARTLSCVCCRQPSKPIGHYLTFLKYHYDAKHNTADLILTFSLLRASYIRDIHYERFENREASHPRCEIAEMLVRIFLELWRFLSNSATSSIAPPIQSKTKRPV